MARRVFLHVGAPKTGTTFLQDTLAANRAGLAEAGLLYPDTRSGNHFQAAIDLIEHPWGGALDKARGSWDHVAAAAMRARGDAVVSHEVLASASREQVRRAHASFEGAELHVIYSARDLGRQIPAEWQEKVKHRGRMQFGAFLRVVEKSPRTGADEWFWRVQGLPDVLDRWSAGLTPAHVHLLTVPPPGAEPGLLWERFAGILGVDPALAVETVARSNASLDAIETAFLRRLNVALKGRSISQPVYADMVRGVLAQQTLSRRFKQIRTELPPESRPFVDEVTAEWREWVQGSGIDVVGDLADLQTRWSEGKWADPDRPRPRAMITIAIEALAEMIVAESERRREEPEAVRMLRRLRR